MDKILKANKVKMQVMLFLDVTCIVCGKNFESGNDKQVSISSYFELQPKIPSPKCPKCSTKYVWNGVDGFNIVIKTEKS